MGGVLPYTNTAFALSCDVARDGAYNRLSINFLIFSSTAAASDISQEDDLEREVEDEMEKIQEDFERAQDEDREIVSDIKAGEDNEITENEEEEISAL